MTESHIRNVIEAALLAAGKPLQPADLVDLFDEGDSRPSVTAIQAALAALAEEYSTRGIEIKETATGFRIQVRRELSSEISRLWPERPPKYTRALLETLALIAYKQPITRAEIEAVRGVAVNPNILKSVIERNWVAVVGHRDVPGRPELLGTTREFLDYFGLKRLDELPPLTEIKALGEIKLQFDLPDPGQLPPLSDGDAEAVGSDAAATADASAVKTVGDPTAATDGDSTAATAGNSTPATDSGGTTSQAESTSDEGGSQSESASGENASRAVDTSGDSASHDVGAVASADEATAKDAAGDSAVAEGAVGEADESSPSAVEGTSSNNVVTADSSADHAAAAGGKRGKENADPTESAKTPSSSTGRGSGRKKKRGKTSAPDSALQDAEEFAASVDADLAAGDDDSSDEDELSAAGPDSSELVAGPRDIED
jgi:segregation and condensation protein B